MMVLRINWTIPKCTPISTHFGTQALLVAAKRVLKKVNHHINRSIDVTMDLSNVLLCTAFGFASIIVTMI